VTSGGRVLEIGGELGMECIGLGLWLIGGEGVIISVLLME